MSVIKVEDVAYVRFRCPDLSALGAFLTDFGLASRIEGERMVLIPPRRRTGETEEHREIAWERIAAE